MTDISARQTNKIDTYNSKKKSNRKKRNGTETNKQKMIGETQILKYRTNGKRSGWENVRNFTTKSYVRKLD